MKYSSLLIYLLSAIGIGLMFFGSTGFVLVKTKPIEVDVLIIHGGAGGTAAGLEAARLGAKTLIIESTDWLGGMLTSAGVSAIDGNNKMPAGIWGVFREKLRTHYGGKAALETGWVSNTLFEPHVGAKLFWDMAQEHPQLNVWFRSELIAVKRNSQGWVARIRKDGQTQQVVARVLIDATDLGDVAAQVGAAFDLGMEAASETGESFAPKRANDIVQDLTMVAILKDFGPGQDKRIPKPKGYDPVAFKCACREVCPDSTGVSCLQMLTYGKLPGNKYMLNWPNAGNDYYANLVAMSPKLQRAAIDSARIQTLRYVYFIQHELGYRQLGLAEDEFPTADGLAFYPYHREGRRIKGLVRVTAHHIISPFKSTLYRTGGIVGDYPIDHHHKKNPAAPPIDFPSVPSFNIPLGALIPKEIPYLLIADKAISVSNIVNGSSRLQPVVLQIGQAAGIMAGLSILEQCTPQALSVRRVQQELLQAGAWLMPYVDVPHEDPHFKVIQRIGACGILRGRGEPFQWANRTWFEPDTTVSWEHIQLGLADLPVVSPEVTTGLVTVNEALELAAALLQTPNLKSTLEARASRAWSAWGLTNFQLHRPVSRRELAVILDTLVDPFNRWAVDWEGKWL